MFLKNKISMKLSCITIDDEPFALKLISSFVEKNQDLELISSFNSSKKALNFLENNLVDCIFLDVEMPDLNGVEFAKILAKKNQKSLVVFVSAYSKYAIDGFKVSATDFLLKPYSYDDFEQSVEKIKIQKRLATLEEEFIFIKIDSKQVKLNLSTITYIESMKDYVKIYSEEREVPYIPLMTLKKLSEMLNDNYLQINRSQIVNFKKIDSFGKNHLTIKKKEFSISEKYRIEFDIKKQSLSN